MGVGRRGKPRREQANPTLARRRGIDRIPVTHSCTRGPFDLQGSTCEHDRGSEWAHRRSLPLMLRPPSQCYIGGSHLLFPVLLWIPVSLFLLSPQWWCYFTLFYSALLYFILLRLVTIYFHRLVAFESYHVDNPCFRRFEVRKQSNILQRIWG